MAEGIVAADPDVLPLGMVIHVQVDAPTARSGRYIVRDTGPDIQGRRIDVYMSDCAEAVRFGRRPVQVRIVSGLNARSAADGRGASRNGSRRSRRH
ncbi:MAG: 3D domain-containing protein [Acidobacteria bacterium]|nr:3D domain-containing protein [Acidobacteriota bacterium]